MRLTWLPGLVATMALAASAYGIKLALPNVPVSPLLTVIILGMILAGTVRLPESWIPGLKLAQRPILRWGVAGLGFKLSLQELAKIGLPAIGVVIVATFAALGFGIWVGRKLGLPEKMATLLAVGSSICGASAIVAADTVVQGEKQDSALSLGIITLLGTVGILLYPLLGHALSLSAFAYGVWNGASLHEMAQVIAAGNGVAGALEPSTVTKLARIALLAPIVFGLSWNLRRRHQTSGDAKVPLVPFFLVGFLLFAAFRTFVEVPKPTAKLVEDIDLFILCVGMAGVGLQADFREIIRAGFRPIAAGLIQWVFLAAVALGLAMLIAR